MAKVGIRELKSKLSHYIALARKGEQVTITDRGKEVAMIVPTGQGDMERQLVGMVKEGTALWSGAKPSGSSAPVISRGKPASEIIIEDRR